MIKRISFDKALSVKKMFLGWDVLPPPYCPDLALSDFHSFRTIQHDLAEHFISYEDRKNWLQHWIVSKEPEFFYRGIHLLHEKWKKVILTMGTTLNKFLFFLFLIKHR